VTNIEKKLRKRLVALKGDRRDPGDRPLTRDPAADARYLEFTQLHKSFPGPNAHIPVVEDFNLTIRKGEFVTLIGHSGCGKSTVLSIVAGLANATLGGVVLDGREVTEPGPDRGVVFQAPCLLPWMTAAENVMLGVSQVFGSMTRAKKHELVAHYLGLVGLGDALHKKPSELSAGMRQRVGIARAFALQPKLLLLDEPFGMLDSLTRYELQQVLLDLWGRDRKTALMVTHDVDEALFLSDRVAMMTSGPRARLGGVLEIPFARPRDRAAIMNEPLYYELREQLIGFLNSQEHEKAPAADDGAAPAPAGPAQGVESGARKTA
jgi:nitrate ABC transporter ATP-binding subunit